MSRIIQRLWQMTSTILFLWVTQIVSNWQHISYCVPVKPLRFLAHLCKSKVWSGLSGQEYPWLWGEQGPHLFLHTESLLKFQNFKYIYTRKVWVKQTQTKSVEKKHLLRMGWRIFFRGSTTMYWSGFKIFSPPWFCHGMAPTGVCILRQWQKHGEKIKGKITDWPGRY